MIWVLSLRHFALSQHVEAFISIPILISAPHFPHGLFWVSSAQSGHAKLDERLFGFGKVGPKFVRGASQVIASQSGRRGVGRISEMCGIVDLDAVLLALDLLIEIGGQAIAIGNKAFQDRDAPFRRSITWPSIWWAHGSFSLFVLLALTIGLAGELADRYVTRRETPKGWPSIERVILEHSV